MAEDLLQPPPWIALQTPPPPSLLQADAEHVALSDRGDPLDCGFVLAGGILAPLPPAVRLPHEDDEDAEGDPEPVEA